MKQYVLDEPGARPPAEALPAPEPSDRRWRWAIVLPAIGAIALVGVYSVVEGRPEPSARSVEAAVVPAYVASTAVAEPVRVVAPPEPATTPAELPPSRITRADGRYVVDLHSAGIGPVLAMLSEATRTTVTGSDIVTRSPSRITTSFVADTPLEAWKGVFGDIASYALTCGPSACAVRFVSLAGVPAASSLSAMPSYALQPAARAPQGTPATADANGEPTPDN